MNKNYRKVPTRFGPEIGFELKPAAAASFRALQEAGLEALKDRLLAQRLDGAWDPAFQAELRRAANEAAALAWVTVYPSLVFPVLFAEKADAAQLRAERQEQIRERSRELLAI